MRRACIILFFFVLGIPTLWAQSDLVFMLNNEGRLIAIPRYFTYEYKAPELSYKTYTPASTRLIDDMLKAYQPSTPVKLDERPMNMQIRSTAYRPFYNAYTSMLRRVSPVAFDFAETELVALNENFTFAVTGRQDSWPGAGGITSITPSLTWHNETFDVSGGGFAARYFTPFNASPELVTGGYLHAGAQVTDWLKVNAWGQRAHYYGKERYNPHMIMNPFFYHNAIGTSLEFKIKDHFGVGAGVQYEFNPMQRKWERQILLFPVFH